MDHILCEILFIAFCGILACLFNAVLIIVVPQRWSYSLADCLFFLTRQKNTTKLLVPLHRQAFLRLNTVS